MQRHLMTLIYGFAIFKMFFGSGNLIFPLVLGQNSSDQWLFGFLGLLCTGIVLPFLGLFVIKLHRGSFEDFFGQAGSVARVALPLFTLSLLGAFGVVPRCITVAHGGINTLLPDLPLWGFSLLFCTICFIICLRDRWIISFLGKWIGPLLLITLAILFGLGVYYAPPEVAVSSLKATEAFSQGFYRGYETMDLFAAFFFSSLIFKQIQAKMGEHIDNATLIKAALKPSIIGATLLGLIYFGFAYLGAHYSNLSLSVSPELILPNLAMHLMGDKGAILIGLLMILSCLTTAVALNNIYARYLCSLFKLSDSKFIWILLGTTAISFIISLYDFKGIAAFLSPMLDISYPSLILLTFLSILTKGSPKLKKTSFYGLLAFMLGYSYL
ncbi:branched-chain amino acid transport system II carrier protein [Candidatus Berkiella aquae]|uniref:Branched-chain amino acid transport system carrier protein n=1 Tax=Candidatus Berkiella aquae TaxID=295108 RepID=A0A0Q9Z124_9GAMM|nr:branched-chain amino acid transport system II carrier protein [Candidatus Berkiella aquae]MCS5711886.1 branched-chain amino acid transport system II carrier protein [Candidatus Berkiella aquae]